MKSTQYLRKLEALFICPICHSRFFINESSLVCRNHHTFDIAKQGYVNLLHHTVKTNYDNSLFIARRKIINETIFFEKLHRALTNVVIKNIHLLHHDRPLIILDAGCGEGSHLIQIRNKLSEVQQSTIGIGIDIAKEGIIEATKNNEENVWFVADLANLPFAKEKIDIILNILSPANYAQFNRVLNETGFIIKVIPRHDYLKEIRDFFPNQNKKERNSNEKIVQLFSTKHQTVTRKNVRYEVELNNQELHSLVQMTPLTWNLSHTSLKRFLQSGIKSITVDLDILIGKKKV